MLDAGCAHGGELASLGSARASNAGSPMLNSDSHGSDLSEERMPGHRPEQAVTAVKLAL